MLYQTHKMFDNLQDFYLSIEGSFHQNFDLKGS